MGGNAVSSYPSATLPMTPATELSGWRFEGNTGRTSLEINFTSTLVPGTRVWFSAFWFNTRHQSGPACSPVATNLQGGGVSMAA